MEKNNQVPVLEVRRLLYELKDLRPDICVRFRLLGQMWQTNFLRVISLSEKGATLEDELTGGVVFIHDLNNVMQFEIDHAFKQYQPHFHYNVNPTMVFY